MEDFEIIFNDNEPEIKVSIDKLTRWKILRNYTSKFLMKSIESNMRGTKENEF